MMIQTGVTYQIKIADQIYTVKADRAGNRLRNSSSGRGMSNQPSPPCDARLWVVELNAGGDGCPGYWAVFNHVAYLDIHTMNLSVFLRQVCADAFAYRDYAEDLFTFGDIHGYEGRANWAVFQDCRESYEKLKGLCGEGFADFLIYGYDGEFEVVQ